MNPVHPAVVHIPLGLAVVLPVVALAVTVALWRGWLAPRAFAVVVLLQALMVGAGFLALRTGEADEDNAADALVHPHEEAAERFMWGAGASLAIGMTGLLLLRRERAMRWIAAATTASAVAVAALAVATGQAGGKIVHGADGAVAQQQRGGHHDDDD